MNNTVSALLHYDDRLMSDDDAVFGSCWGKDSTEESRARRRVWRGKRVAYLFPAWNRTSLVLCYAAVPIHREQHYNAELHFTSNTGALNR